VPLEEKIIRQANAVLVLTDHDGIDYRWVASLSRLFVDTRNVSFPFRKNFDNIMTA